MSDPESQRPTALFDGDACDDEAPRASRGPVDVSKSSFPRLVGPALARGSNTLETRSYHSLLAHIRHARTRFEASTSSSESPSRSTTSGALRRGCGTGGPRFRTAGGFGTGAGGRRAGFRASHRSQHGPFPCDGPGSFPKWPTSCRRRHPSFIPQYRAMSSNRSRSLCNLGPRRFFRPNPRSNFWTLPTS